MFKKLFLIIIILVVVLAGLQIFGGRDFSQVSLAWDKYTHGGDMGSFATDVGIIFAGEKVRESVLPSSEYAQKIMYRWTDELGVVHISERKPNVDNFEEIRMGDLDYKVEKGMDKADIDRVLNKNNNKKND